MVFRKALEGRKMCEQSAAQRYQIQCSRHQKARNCGLFGCCKGFT
ncbi:hypothetical protein SAMN05216255_3810 [Pseudomonas segetis]|uniref:Uncharacterized protein n=1 Tax=Pseudomonas segetis TaxID=298908 RepID=A0A239IBK4_9PSED|nr:hypothetical protein SAMN05216255_3810 [Pseudomonas segetis]